MNGKAQAMDWLDVDEMMPEMGAYGDTVELKSATLVWRCALWRYWETV